MGPNPIQLVSLGEDREETLEVGTHRKRPCEEVAGERSSTHQGERPQEKSALLSS